MNCIEALGRDVETVGQKVLEIEDLIDIALKSDHPHRFRAVMGLAKAADCLMSMGEAQQTQEESFMSLVSPFLGFFKETASSSMRRSKAEELEALVKLKGTLMESGEGSSQELQARIDLLKSELK